MLWRYSVLVAVSVCIGGGGAAGQDRTDCTGESRRPPSWLDSVAPRVSLTSDRVVTISWSRAMLLSNPECRHRWQIVVEKEGERRQVCSGTTSAREKEYFCTLDLSMRQYCGQEFSFYLTVLDQQDSERLWLYSPQKSLLQLRCGGLSSVTVMKSSSQQETCAGYEPVWRREPLFYRVDPINFRIQWNKRHIDNINCVAGFLLQIWDVDTQRVLIKTRIDKAVSGDNFYKTLPVQPCKNYRYRLTAITVARTSIDVEGSFKTPCEAENVDGRNREFQRSLEWNSLPLTSHGIPQRSLPSLAQLLILGLTLILVN